jgi:uracil-DNA glycosylase
MATPLYQSNDIIDTLKKYNNWFFNDNIKRPKIDKPTQNYIYRLYNYCLNNPNLIKYLNKYLNDFNMFNEYIKVEELELWFDTFKTLFKQANIKTSRELYFSKYNPPKRIAFNKLLSDYLNIDSSIYINQDELNTLYLLYEYNIIQQKDIDNISELLSDKGNKINFIEEVPKIEVKTNFNKKIIELNNNLLNYISNRNQCKGCSLYNKGKVLFDTNIIDIDVLDLCIIGISPTLDEIKTQIPFSNQYGKVLRSCLQPIIDSNNLKVAYVNLIPCYAENADNLKNIFTYCKGILDQILQTFKPKLKLLVGVKTAQLYGVKGSATKLINSKINDNYIIMDPADINSRNVSKFKESIQNLESILKQNNTNNSILIQTDTNELNNIQTNNIETDNNIKEDYTLFNINVIEDNIIYIFIDSLGNKKYIIEEASYPIYIKDDKYQNCNYIEDNITAICQLTMKQKKQLMYQLNNNLKQIVEN